MSRSTYSLPKWYTSAHVLLSLWRWSENDLLEMEFEKEMDEEERVRAAEAVADYKLMQNWELYNAALNPPASSIRSSIDFITRRAVRGTDGVQAMLREFWRERV